MKKATLILSIALFANGLTAQQSDTLQFLRNYELGEVSIISHPEQESVSADSPGIYFADDAANIASVIPGVNLVNFGSRGESSLAVRGFDIRSVPVFYDGIPIYVPYDGYIDLSRIMIRNVSKVSLEKGFTAGGFGAGTLGGAINIISKRPVDRLEISAGSIVGSGKAATAYLSLGSNLGKIYFSGNLNAKKQDFFPLSAKFDTSGLSVSEDGKFRDNSYMKAISGGLKIGITPNSFDEYSLNYLFQSSEKGTPPYAGRDQQQVERFWQWPYWKKNSVYFIGRKRTGDQSYLIFRAYYDDFSNKLSSYDDNSYSTQFRRYAFNSYYDDYSLGSNMEYNLSVNEKNKIKIFGSLKDDHHSEYNEGEAQRNFQDFSYTLGLEDSYRISSKAEFLGSISYSGRSGLMADDYNPADSSISELPANSAGGTSLQAAVNYDLNERQELGIGVYKKIRFATMKERYSYRAGFAIPNPELAPERSTQFELSYRGNIAGFLDLRGAVFYSINEDAIVSVYDTITALSQSINIGSARTFGIESSAHTDLGQYVSLTINYTFLKMKNISDPETFFTHIPEHDLITTIQVHPMQKLDFGADIRYMSKRYSTSYGTIAKSFASINIMAEYDLKPLSIGIGIENLFDTNYEIAEGYPEPGRIFFGRLQYTL